MRHKMKKYKIGNNPDHRKHLLANLAKSMISHEKIKTTHTKTKALRPYIEKLVTLAKKDTIANRQQVFKKVQDRDLVKKLFTELGPKFKERNGGYTRILKLADGRVGDNAKMAVISFVD